MANKRPRSTNFTKEECSWLTTLVERNKEIIECKSSDAVTWKIKEEAWQNIERLFNAQSGIGGHRCAKTLKNKYELLKRQTRKKSALIRQELYRTGGGPNDSPTLDPVEEKIKSMILITCDGQESFFDSDLLPGTSETCNKPLFEGNADIHPSATPTGEAEITESEGATLQVTVDVHSGPVVTTEENPAIGSLFEIPTTFKNTPTATEDAKLYGTPTRQWDASSRRLLKTKIHPALKSAKKTAVDTSLEARLELIALQKLLVAEEREALKRKMEWEYEEHKKRLEVLDLEISIKKKLLK